MQSVVALKYKNLHSSLCVCLLSLRWESVWLVRFGNLINDITSYEQKGRDTCLFPVCQPYPLVLLNSSCLVKFAKLHMSGTRTTVKYLHDHVILKRYDGIGESDNTKHSSQNAPPVTRRIHKVTARNIQVSDSRGFSNKCTLLMKTKYKSIQAWDCYITQDLRGSWFPLLLNKYYALQLVPTKQSDTIIDNTTHVRTMQGSPLSQRIYLQALYNAKMPQKFSKPSHFSSTLKCERPRMHVYSLF